MRQLSLPRPGAGTVAALTCLLLATPLAAQQATTTTQPAAASAPAATPAPAAPTTTATAPATTEVPAAPARDPGLPQNLSPMGMFLAADRVVKAVMIGLAFASILTWTVLVAKLLELAGAMRRAQSGIRRIEAAADLPAALAATDDRRDPVSLMIRAAATEYHRSAPALEQAGDAGVKERVESHLERIEAGAGRSMSRGTGVLATIGSTAPFVGLFGTVWGIMNSFIGISEAQTTNLAVVAPGIAEALLATAIGLVAAIPAVVIYNVFARAITGYRLRLANASAGVRRLVSRDLDFRGTVRAGA
ncbi:tonB-system energizer ExbB [Paracoccus sp. (in: a-proteobacteria)]|uniref:tonB-system energizer ExbB n=1 Tax=Paracoccus sp. TaxID=267 RepID=UPI003220438B